MASALFILTVAPLLVMYVGALLAKFDFADQTKWFGQEWRRWRCSPCSSPGSVWSSPH